MYRRVEGIGGPGDYVIAEDPKIATTPEGKRCTILGIMPFKAEWGLIDHLRSAFSFTKNRIYKKDEGEYVDGIATKVYNGDNFMEINGLLYHLYYLSGTAFKSKDRVSRITIMDIAGVVEESIGPRAILDPGRDGLMSITIKSHRTGQDTTKWGTWFEYRGENPGEVILSIRDCLDQIVRNNRLALWLDH